MINVYFYRTSNPDNVIASWPGCTAVPAEGSTVELGNRPHHSTWKVEQVTWSHPSAEQPTPGNQVVDIALTIITPAS